MVWSFFLLLVCAQVGLKLIKKKVFFSFMKKSSNFVPIFLGLSRKRIYRVFHWFRLAKFDNGGLILSLIQFLLLPQQPLKIKLASKVIKINSKHSTRKQRSKWCFLIFYFRLWNLAVQRGFTRTWSTSWSRMWSTSSRRSTTTRSFFSSTTSQRHTLIGT